MSGLTPKHAYVVNGRLHFPAERLYVEKLQEQIVIRMRNDFGGLYMVLDADMMRSIGNELLKFADETEAGAAALADAVIKKAMGGGTDG